MAGGKIFLAELARDTVSQMNKRWSFPIAHFSGTITESKERFLSIRFMKFFKAVRHLITHASARSYGTAVMSCGVMTLLLYFTRLAADMSAVTPIIGALLTLLALPFLFSDKPVPLFLQDFALTDYIFFEFFCIKRFNKMDSVKRVPAIVSLLFGVLVALVGLFCPSWYATVAIAALIFVGVTLLSPEFAFFAAFLALPYMSLLPYASVIFVGVILLAEISFLIKAFFGKRVFYIDGYDGIIGALMLVVLVSGIFIKGISSFTWSIGMVVSGFGYTISGNVVTNRRLADRAVNSIVISSIPPAIVSIVFFLIDVFGGRGETLIDKGVFFGFPGSESAAIFMTVASVFSVAMLIQSHGSKKIFYAIVFAVEFAALILTGELFAVLALVLAFFAYYFICVFRGSAIFLPAISALPYAALLLPNTVLDSVFSVIPSLENVESLLFVWSESLSAFVRNIVFGIGIGADSFAEEMSAVGISAKNASNLFIELGLEAGIFALLCLVALLLLRVVHSVRYYLYVRNSEVSVLTPLCTVCVFCLVSYGAFSYIFADMFSMYLFWCVFGIGSAALRVAKRETDDRIQYYEDTRARNSSSIDIEIL